MLVLFVAAAAAVFFFVRGVQLRSDVAKMTLLEIKRADLEQARARAEKLPWKVRLNAELRKHGYEGDLFTVVAAMAFLYLTVTVALRLVGLSYTYGALIALPGSVAVVVFATITLAKRRRRAFNRQLVELLELVAAQIQSGHGAQKALTMVVPTLQEPLRGEMNAVLDARIASKDLIGAMKSLAERYPSRAISMFISALEIDQAEGQAIGPALEQAADLLKRDFSLAAEANAEISQTRGEFFAVIGILGLISAKMIFGGDDQSAYTSVAGLTVLVIGLANVALGITRFLRLLNTARGDT